MRDDRSGRQAAVSRFEASYPDILPAGAAGSDFAHLMHIVRAAGLLDRRYAYYAVRVAALCTALVVLALAVRGLGDSWWQLALAAVAAALSGQLVFLAHDAAHREIFHSHRRNDLVGYACEAVTGVGFQWWMHTHNKHHEHPNDEADDPDLAPVFAYSREQALAMTGATRWVAAHQAYLYFPVLLNAAWIMHATTIQSIVRRKFDHAYLEALIMAGHCVAYAVALFAILPPGKAALFILVHQGLMGLYVGAAIAPNHKGMPLVTQGEKLDFLRKQVITARNILGGRWVDLVLCGLNYQIEHHLFPSMPSVNLRAAQPLVRQYCEKIGVTYTYCGLIESYARVVRHLHDAGAPLRRREGAGAPTWR